MHKNSLWDEKKLDQKHLPRINNVNELKDSIQIDQINSKVGEEVSINGWVKSIRSSGKISFIQFRDGRGDIQVVAEEKNLKPEIWNQISELTQESSLQITGIVKEDKRSESGFEISMTDMTIVQISPEFPISNKEHGPEFLLDNRHLWLRSNKQRAILLVRDEIFFSITSFLREEGFIRIDTPIFQPVSCEDTSELFQVNYFGEKTYLTQSGQLYCESAEIALGRTYDFGPVFRAEKSKTRKHLIEFWMMDAELPFTDLKGLMDFEEKMLKRIISDCLKNCKKELNLLERDTESLERYVKNEFVRLTHKETIELLNKKYNQNLTPLDDIGAPEEANLSKEFDMPVFITDWPAEIKAFYMPRYKDGDMERVRAVDLVAPEGFGELMGGSERIFDYNEMISILEKLNYKYEDYAWYLDLRKYGTIPHSGFGIGLERTIRFITGIQHIRETIPFPRMLNRLYP
jgi:asparaginyl-tRNA synthetase